MQSEAHMKRYSDKELEARRRERPSNSEFGRVRAKTEAELEADIAADPDFRDVPHDWFKAAKLVGQAPKQLISLRLDTDIIEWFKRQGPGYQTRMNAVLRSFVDHQRPDDGDLRT